ncbi:hypothetical protein HanIR_Chr16g0791931 [Helianthus annuus]|nr:hypothetical protein HanIR_Chr16g0791931 [Helianthus annuus]
METMVLMVEDGEMEDKRICGSTLSNGLCERQWRSLKFFTGGENVYTQKIL